MFLWTWYTYFLSLVVNHVPCEFSCKRVFKFMLREKKLNIYHIKMTTNVTIYMQIVRRRRSRNKNLLIDLLLMKMPKTIQKNLISLLVSSFLALSHTLLLPSNQMRNFFLLLVGVHRTLSFVQLKLRQFNYFTGNRCCCWLKLTFF